MIRTPHDSLVKSTFARPATAAALLRTTLPPALVRQIDWRTLKLVPGSFVDELLSPRYTDLLFTVLLAGRETFLYMLFEHLSSPEHLLALRLLRYASDAWHAHVRDHPDTRHIPALIPVVLYHGSTEGSTWQGATSLEGLYTLPAAVADQVGPYLARWSFVLDDLSAQSDADLRQRAMTALPTLVLWVLKHGRTERDMIEALRRVVDLIREVRQAPQGSGALVAVLRYILEVSDCDAEDIGTFLEAEIGPDAREELMTGAERLRQEGHEQGVKQGQLRARRAVLRELLEQRFGTLPVHARRRIQRAGDVQLRRWTPRVLSAASLEEVFAEAQD